MNTDEIAVRIVEGWLATTRGDALYGGININAKNVKKAGENLGALYDKVFKAVAATHSGQS